MKHKKIKLTWIKIRNKNREVYIDPKDVYYCQAERSYSRIFLKSGKILMICKSLNILEEQLINDNFLRCHRSYLINIQEIIKVDYERKIILLKSCQIPFSEQEIAKKLSKRYFGK